MFVHTYGDDGPLVVLLHGVPGSARDWREVAQTLAADHRVLVPDLLGFGASPRPRDVGALWADAQAAALSELLDEPATFAAHDFGGPTALHLHRHRPELFERLLLLATNAFGDTPIPLPIRAVTWPVVGGVAERVLMSPAGLRLVAAGRADVGDGGQARSSRTIFATALRELEARFAPVEAELGALACPVEVLWGDRDPFFALTEGERLAAAIPGARLQVLAGAGHFLPTERPEAVAAAIAGVRVPA